LDEFDGANEDNLMVMQ